MRFRTTIAVAIAALSIALFFRLERAGGRAGRTGAPCEPPAPAAAGEDGGAEPAASVAGEEEARARREAAGPGRKPGEAMPGATRTAEGAPATQAAEGVVSGLVIGEEGGPVQGASLRLIPLEDGARPWLPAHGDGEGRFAFHGAAP